MGRRRREGRRREGGRLCGCVWVVRGVCGLCVVVCGSCVVVVCGGLWWLFWWFLWWLLLRRFKCLSRHDDHTTNKGGQLIDSRPVVLHHSAGPHAMQLPRRERRESCTSSHASVISSAGHQQETVFKSAKHGSNRAEPSTETQRETSKHRERELKQNTDHHGRARNNMKRTGLKNPNSPATVTNGGTEQISLPQREKKEKKLCVHPPRTRLSTRRKTMHEST